ncbi:MAG: hypothetical protein OXF11_07585 [Deltaproteobacteria bacterium]|nr:hypothetical protein [Deltaproteobacteria bacterium]
MIQFEAVSIGDLICAGITLIVGSVLCGLVWRGLREIEVLAIERSELVDAQSKALLQMARGIKEILDRSDNTETH